MQVNILSAQMQVLLEWKDDEVTAIIIGKVQKRGSFQGRECFLLWGDN